jgi:c-di-GMP-binding flagellar brake protein YcgR
MSAEKRKSKRVNIFEDYFYYPKNKNKKINCKLNNISVTGACITSNKKIAKEDIIYFNIRGTKDMALKSKAVWKIDNQYGIQFILDSNEEFEIISHIMNNIININT